MFKWRLNTEAQTVTTSGALNVLGQIKITIETGSSLIITPKKHSIINNLVMCSALLGTFSGWRNVRCINCSFPLHTMEVDNRKSFRTCCSPWSSSPQPWLSRLSTGSWSPRPLWRTARTGFPPLPLASSQPGKDRPPAGTPRRSRGAAAESADQKKTIFKMLHTPFIVWSSARP